MTKTILDAHEPPLASDVPIPDSARAQLAAWIARNGPARWNADVGFVWPLTVDTVGASDPETFESQADGWHMTAIGWTLTREPGATVARRGLPVELYRAG